MKNQNPIELTAEKLCEICECLMEIRKLTEKSVKLLEEIADKPPKEKK